MRSAKICLLSICMGAAVQAAPATLPSGTVNVRQPPLEAPATTQAPAAPTPSNSPAAPAAVNVPQPPPVEAPDKATATPVTPPSVAPTPAAAPASEPGSVLVTPFSDYAATSNPMMVRAMTQDLVVDLMRTTRAHIQPAAAVPAGDVQSALNAGRQANATIVIFGQLQNTGVQVRATGQVLDVASGKVLGAFSDTGRANDLFPLEDSVAGQILRTLPAGWVVVSLPPLKPGTNQPDLNAPMEPPTAPAGASAYEPPYSSYTYPDYGSVPGVSYSYTYWGYPYYPYGYYGYAVPFYAPGIYFYGGWDHYHHGYWGHGWDHHGYVHSYSGYSHSPSNGGSHHH